MLDSWEPYGRGIQKLAGGPANLAFRQHARSAAGLRWCRVAMYRRISIWRVFSSGPPKAALSTDDDGADKDRDAGHSLHAAASPSCCRPPHSSAKERATQLSGYASSSAANRFDKPFDVLLGNKSRINIACERPHRWVRRIRPGILQRRNEQHRGAQQQPVALQQQVAEWERACAQPQPRWVPRIRPARLQQRRRQHELVGSERAHQVPIWRPVRRVSSSYPPT
jgi:hypothetical protein